MARVFRFALQKILEVRLWEEKQAELALAAKTGQAAACERRIVDLLDRQRRSLGAPDPGALDAADLVTRERFRSRLGREAQDQQEVLARLTVEREDLLAAYLVTRRRREVLSKLREKQALAFTEEQRRREVLALDDLNMGAFIRKMGRTEAELG